MYIVFLGIGIVYGVWRMYPFETGSQLIFYIINLLYYAAAIFFVYSQLKDYKAGIKKILIEN